MEELIRSYFDLAYTGHDDLDENGEDPFMAAARIASAAGGNDHILNSGLVEDASYFRRAQELIAKSKDPGGANS